MTSKILVVCWFAQIVFCMQKTMPVAYCQPSPQFFPGIYTDAANQLYVHPSSELSVKLLGGAVKQTGNNSLKKEHTAKIPLLTSGEYQLVLSSKEGEDQSVMTFVVDDEPPHTSMQIDRSPAISKDGNKVFGKGVKVNLSSVDRHSGTYKIYYTLDKKGEWQAYNGEFPIHQTGLVEIAYFAVDQVGNKEKINNEKFWIDQTAPFSKFSLTGPQYFFNGVLYVNDQTRFKLDAVDDQSGVDKIYYRLKNGKEQAYSGPVPLPAEDGEQFIQYYATDMVGNQSKVFTERFSYVLDTDKPSLSYNFIPGISGHEIDGGTVVYILAGHCKISLLAIDEKSGLKGVYYSINDGEEIPYEKPLENLPPNKKTQIRFRAVDKAGNVAEKEINVWTRP